MKEYIFLFSPLAKLLLNTANTREILSYEILNYNKKINNKKTNYTQEKS